MTLQTYLPENSYLSEDGSYTFRDSEDNKLTLMIYSMKEKDIYDIVFFKNGMTYTAQSSKEGIEMFFKSEKLFCLKTKSYEEIQSELENFSESDYHNMLNIVNSEIDISELKSEQKEQEIISQS